MKLVFESVDRSHYRVASGPDAYDESRPDTLRACLASVLELSIEDVPHLDAAPPERQFAFTQWWLSQIGLFVIGVHATESLDLPDLDVLVSGRWPPGTPLINRRGKRTSSAGERRMTVGRIVDGRAVAVHDPSVLDADCSLFEPNAVFVFGPLDPTFGRGPRREYQAEFSDTGDCFRASLASVLGFALARVPHFIGEFQGDEWIEAYRSWLRTLGLFEILIETTDAACYSVEGIRVDAVIGGSYCPGGRYVDPSGVVRRYLGAPRALVGRLDNGVLTPIHEVGTPNPDFTRLTIQNAVVFGVLDPVPVARSHQRRSVAASPQPEIIVAPSRTLPHTSGTGPEIPRRSPRMPARDRSP